MKANYANLYTRLQLLRITELPIRAKEGSALVSYHMVKQSILAHVHAVSFQCHDLTVLRFH